MDWTLALALLGAVLGVINTFFSLWRDRVHLRVRVNPVFEKNSKQFMGLGVIIVNLSCFDVTLQQVDILINRNHDPLAIHPDVLAQLPKCIKPRAAEAVWFSMGTLQDPAIPNKFRFRVGTACGVKKLTKRVHWIKSNLPVTGK